MSLQIGPYKLVNPVVLAPMAGITDKPFRNLCKNLGAGLVVSEMLTSNSRLWHSAKSQRRLIQPDDPEPRSVQIAGTDPVELATAAQLCVAQGAQIIDINMGCPAKKVCKKAAGSALLRDEPLVASILQAVVKAVEVPVTLKIRTGWSPDQRNGVTIARIAEQSGIQALAVHGRTKVCAFKGDVEYDTIARIKENVSIPVLANGDITDPLQAQKVIDYTGVDGVMIGRAAQGNPWIFREVKHFLETGKPLSAPSKREVNAVVIAHLRSLYAFYGERMGVRIARKHVSWYVQKLPMGGQFMKGFNQLDSASKQIATAQEYFEHLLKGEVMAA